MSDSPAFPPTTQIPLVTFKSDDPQPQFALDKKTNIEIRRKNYVFWSLRLKMKLLTNLGKQSTKRHLKKIYHLKRSGKHTWTT
jgi:hypothetical protein